MITEDYVSFKTARLLKEKGFEGYCRYVNAANNDPYSNSEACISYPQPTQQMAMKWLREEKEIYITIIYGDYPSVNKVFWTPQIDSLEGIDLPDSFYKEYNTYEEACEAAIKYCLENLI